MKKNSLPRSVAPAWRWPLTTLVLMILWLLVWYRDTALGMATIWERSDTYAHGFLVPLIVLWLIWRKRAEVAQLTPKPSGLAVLLMLGAAALWLMGDLVAVNAATQLALTAMLVLAVPAVLGWAVARALLFPLAFMFFAVPIGDFMMPQLMEWTADFTVLALRASAIPVYREGQQFVIPTGTWSVVEACSGIRYLIASVTVGSLFAYLNYRSMRRRLAFVLVAFLVPVLANWLRAYMIVMLGHYSGNTIATGVDHLIYGWLFFGVVILIMFAVGSRWADAPAQLPVAAHPALAPRGGVGGAHLITLAALVLVSVLPHGATWVIQRQQIATTPTLEWPGALAGGWQRDAHLFTHWKPAFQNPSTELTLAASRGTDKVGLYVGYYRQQSYERKLVSSENLLVRYADTEWARTASGSRAVDLLGRSVVLRTGELRSASVASHDAQRLTAWQVYWVNGRFVASDSLAKIQGALSRLSGRGDDSAVVIVYAPADNAAGADKAMEAFLLANAAVLEEMLRTTRSH